MFGEKIKVFAKRKFGSLNDLATAMEVNANQMSAYTTERSKPSYEIMLKLFQQGCDIHWLLDDNRDIYEEINEFVGVESKDIGRNSVILSFTPEQFEVIKGIILSFKIKMDEGDI